MQTLGDSRAAEYMKGRKTLEINPEHPIVQALKQKVDSDASGAKVSKVACHVHWHLLWAAQTQCQMMKRLSTDVLKLLAIP